MYTQMELKPNLIWLRRGNSLKLCISVREGTKTENKSNENPLVAASEPEELITKGNGDIDRCTVWIDVLTN